MSVNIHGREWMDWHGLGPPRAGVRTRVQESGTRSEPPRAGMNTRAPEGWYVD